MKYRWLVLFVSISVALIIVRCGGGNASSSTKGSSDSGSSGAVPQYSSVAVLVLENKGFGDVVGSASMPYLNSLIPQGALATQYTASMHPSLPNYFMLTTGQTIATNDSYVGPTDVDNVARTLASAGKSWKSYMESIPSSGYTGGDAYPYIKHHNPFAYFTDVLNDPSQRSRIVSYSEFQGDLNAGRLPNFAFIAPDNTHNAHDCAQGQSPCGLAERMAAADGWLRVNISQILSNGTFISNGLLIIVFDEDANESGPNGGPVLALFLGAHVKAGFRSSIAYGHANLLRTSMNAIGVSHAPGAAASAAPMSDMFQ